MSITLKMQTLHLALSCSCTTVDLASLLLTVCCTRSAWILWALRDPVSRSCSISFYLFTVFCLITFDHHVCCKQWVSHPGFVFICFIVPPWALLWEQWWSLRQAVKIFSTISPMWFLLLPYSHLPLLYSLFSEDLKFENLAISVDERRENIFGFNR